MKKVLSYLGVYLLGIICTVAGAFAVSSTGVFVSVGGGISPRIEDYSSLKQVEIKDSDGYVKYAVQAYLTVEVDRENQILTVIYKTGEDTFDKDIFEIRDDMTYSVKTITAEDIENMKDINMSLYEITSKPFCHHVTESIYYWDRYE